MLEEKKETSSPKNTKESSLTSAEQNGLHIPVPADLPSLTSKFFSFYFEESIFHLDSKQEVFPHFYDELWTLNDKINFLCYEKTKRKAGNPFVGPILEFCQFSFYSLLQFVLEYVLQSTIRGQRFALQTSGGSIMSPLKDDDKCSICLCELFDGVEEMLRSFNDPEYTGTKLIPLIVSALEKDSEEDVIRLEHCDNHFFHAGCIDRYLKAQAAKFIKCPNCFCIYGELTGDQPDGTFHSTINPFIKCVGFENFLTIVINYNFPNGQLQNGTKYRGTQRTAYLPANQEGLEILEMLKVAFARRLIYTVGTSITTGRSNVVVWNNVHHKTSLFGGNSSISSLFSSTFIPE